MASKLIKLEDGTLIEVEAKEGEVQQVSWRTADKVQESLDKVKPVLTKVCEPIVEAWRELNKTMMIEQVEVELGLSFEGEGNIYITKAKSTANLTIRVLLKDPDVNSGKTA